MKQSVLPVSISEIQISFFVLGVVVLVNMEFALSLLLLLLLLQHIHVLGIMTYPERNGGDIAYYDPSNWQELP
jgi:hypothetical protein